MKDITSIDLIFENLEYLRIYWEGVSHMAIKGIEYHSYRFSNCLSQVVMGSDITIVLQKDLLEHPELYSLGGFHKLEGVEVLSSAKMHLELWRDITNIEINYADGTEDTFGVFWHEGEEPDVNLYQKFDNSDPDVDILTIKADNYTE